MNQKTLRLLCVKHISLLGIALAALCLVPVENTFAKDSVAGKVVYIQGDVTAVDRSKTERKLTTNSEVFSGDLIKTSSDGRVQMRFKDGSFMSLIPKSEFLIEGYSYGEGKNKEKGAFSLIKGGLRTLSGLLRKDRYNVKTPVATIGLRGTWFTAEMVGSEKLLVRVGFDPQDPTGVELSNNAGNVVLERGQAALVSGSGSLPQVLADAAISEISSVASADNILNVVSAANAFNIDKQATAGTPTVISPGKEAIDSHINTAYPDGPTCDKTGNIRGCGVNAKLNAAITKPNSSTGMQSKVLKNAGVVEHFDTAASNADVEDISIYGNDSASNNVGISVRPNRVKKLTESTIADTTKIANNNVATEAFKNAKGFSAEVTKAGFPGVPRTTIKEYQRVTNMSGFEVPLSWVRWQGGNILDYSNGADPTVIELSNQSVHAVFGESLNSSVSTLGAGSATYHLVGGTTPTSFDGLNTGTLKSGNIKLDFASSSLALNLVVNHPVFASSGQTGNADFSMTGSGIGVDNVGTFSATALSVVSGGCVGCSGNVNGLFSGEDAGGPLSAGMTYQITDGVEGITGAAGFEKEE